MLKHTLILTLSICAMASLAMAQENWNLIESPTVENLTSITFFSPLIGIITADNETLLRTEDGGKNWVIVTVPVGSTQVVSSSPTDILTKNFNSSKSNTGNGTIFQGIIVGDGGFITHTTNSGQGWIALESGTTADLFGISFPDSNTVFVVGDSGTVLTLALGGSCLVAIQGVPTTEQLNAVDYFDESTGYIFDNNETALLDHDDCPWQVIQGIPTTERLNAVVFFDKNTGVIFGNNETALRTADAGSSWTTFTIDTSGMTSSTPADILAKNFNSSKSNTSSFAPGGGAMVGDGGTVVVTQNHWLNSSNSSSGTVANLFGVDYFDTTTIVVAGAGGTVSISYNGGINFQPVDGIPTAVDLMDVFFTDDNIGFIVGNSGVILSTLTPSSIVISAPDTLSEPGDTVTVAISMSGASGAEIYSLQFSLLYNGDVLAAESAFIDNTTLPGAAGGWLLEFEVSKDTLSIAAAGSNMLGPDGVLLYASFIVVDTALDDAVSPIAFGDFLFNTGSPVPSGFFDGSTRVVVSGGDIDENGVVQAFDASLVLRFLTFTMDFTLWQELEADVSDNDEVTEMDASLILQHVVGNIDLFPSESGPSAPLADGELSIPDVVEASGNEIVLPVFLTGGDNVFSGSFEMLYDPDALELTEVRTTSATEGFIVAHKTIDGEADLFLAGSVEIAGDHSIFEVVFTLIPDGPSQTEVVLVSARLNDNVFWVRGDTARLELLVTVGEEGKVPAEFTLSQNHPNPFNPETIITYALLIPGEVSLIIYDIRGRKVAQLVNGLMPAGYHKATWDASRFASGVYIYRLIAGDFVRTRKMLLLK